MKDVIVIIGANGGIGRAITAQAAQRFGQTPVYALSRHPVTDQVADNVTFKTVQTDNEADIAEFCQTIKHANERVVTAICTIGTLHGTVDELSLSPEKKLEDLNESQLLAYFKINSVIPALWLKHLVGVMSSNPSQIACLSARVGSISDNRLGGWYGYRASKAALNMLVKTAAVEYGRRAKSTSLVCYHPGTVDTALSEPFQHNVKPEKLFTAQFTANQLLTALETVESQHSPYFLDWDHKVVSW